MAGRRPMPIGQGPRRRVCADGDHDLLDVALHEAIRPGQRIRIPAAILSFSQLAQAISLDVLGCF